MLLGSILRRVLDGDGGREAWGEEPASPVAADSEAASRVDTVKVARVEAAVKGRAWRCHGSEQRLLHLAVLLDQLSGHDPEDLLDTFSALGTNLVAGVPAHLLAPEARAPFATRAARLAQDATHAVHITLALQSGCRHSRHQTTWSRSRGWGVALARRQVLGNVCYAALEGDLAAGRVTGNDVSLCADDVQDDVGRQVAPQLSQPHAHLCERLGVRDAVAEDARIGAAVVESRYGAKPFLAGYK